MRPVPSASESIVEREIESTAATAEARTPHALGVGIGATFFAAMFGGVAYFTLGIDATPLASFGGLCAFTLYDALVSNRQW
jgi:hypothetical protein